MGQAKRRSRSRRQIIESASRCTYCCAVEVTTIDHMPPIGLFAHRDRPSGGEFACCDFCNCSTRGADAVAMFFANIEVVTEEAWKIDTILKLREAIKKYAPGVLEELFSDENWQNVLVKRNGLLHRSVKAQVNGQRTKQALNLFATKAAFATFFDLIDRPLEANGLVFTEWFLNGGLSNVAYQSITSIMPMQAELRQGSKSSGKQFSLRFNSDGKGIVAGMLTFQGSLHVLIIATDREDLVTPLFDSISAWDLSKRPTAHLTRAEVFMRRGGLT